MRCKKSEGDTGRRAPARPHPPKKTTPVAGENGSRGRFAGTQRPGIGAQHGTQGNCQHDSREPRMARLMPLASCVWAAADHATEPECRASLGLWISQARGCGVREMARPPQASRRSSRSTACAPRASRAWRSTMPASPYHTTPTAESCVCRKTSCANGWGPVKARQGIRKLDSDTLPAPFPACARGLPEVPERGLRERVALAASSSFFGSRPKAISAHSASISPFHGRISAWGAS